MTSARIRGPARPDTEVVFDPATYTEGLPFDALARLRHAAPRHPNPHLTLGHGPHFCLGARLARTQMSALFSEVLRPEFNTDRTPLKGPSVGAVAQLMK